MLLAIAIVASMGVTAAFADVSYTNAESANHYLDRLYFFDAAISSAKEKQATLYDVQAFWDHYFVQTSWMLSKYNNDDTDPGYIAEKKAYDLEKKLELADLRLAVLGTDYATEEIWSLYDFDATAATDLASVEGIADAEFTALQAIITAANTMNAEEDNEFWYAYFSKLAAKDVENAAAAEAAAALAKRIADATKGIDTTTPAGQLLYDGTVAKLMAQDSLSAAKKAADTAKKAIATAQKGAITEAQAAVLDAQAFAYQNMAVEINTAVADYVASVYTAIDEFYYELYK